MVTVRGVGGQLDPPVQNRELAVLDGHGDGVATVGVAEMGRHSSGPHRSWPAGLVMIARGSRTQWRPLCLNS